MSKVASPHRRAACPLERSGRTLPLREVYDNVIGVLGGAQP
ncbi:hypothetical protein Trad_1896 [Truepera radiovictrix DSM 17093]|uniref:Uncharacterized protein n=1 Tax=Truepera radiovictrix (strain DSM 17093 / CIP 108686 / LMG 22925 / RQ-24) TaxID=649638 RepID=D7CQM8_TRURR|nr:hypothetical protein [Truepera radiovictrix]ADI15012.1 hypothetical protein Trad_1896 [Truepera radiovictrix DSM 17093]WMT56435.1 hypothetical protein RCV51_10515 [Truepera radiovictrix]